MVGSDDDTIQIDGNNERRLCGLDEYDAEDYLREDDAALFSHSSKALVHVGDGKEGGGEEGAEDEQNAKRSRPSTSAV